MTWDEAFASRYDDWSPDMTQDVPFYVGLAVGHTVQYAVGDNRIDIVLDDGATSSLWWATRNEWLGLLDAAGFEVESLYGGFAGEAFGDDSREYVFVARPSESAALGVRS
jgi:hypothetical protein